MAGLSKGPAEKEKTFTRGANHQGTLLVTKDIPGVLHDIDASLGPSTRLRGAVVYRRQNPPPSLLTIA